MIKRNVKKATKRIHEGVETHEDAKKDLDFDARGFIASVSRHTYKVAEEDLSCRHDLLLYRE